MYGVSAFAGQLSGESTLVFKFSASTVSGDAEGSAPRFESTFIPKEQIRLLLFNPSYLEAFNNYHLLDIYGLIYVNDIDFPIFDKVGD